jgi:hypothetical protein
VTACCFRFHNLCKQTINVLLYEALLFLCRLRASTDVHRQSAGALYTVHLHTFRHLPALAAL